MTKCPYCGKLTDPNLENCPHCGGFLQQKAAPRGRTPSKGRQACPNCKALVQEGDIICVVCGTNLLTGQKIDGEAAPAAERRNYVPWFAGGAVAVLVVAVIGVFWGYVSTRDPLNQALRLIENRQYLEAMDILTAYVERVPDDERAWTELAHLQFKANRLMDAAQSFERVVSLHPANTEAALWAVVSLGTGNVPGAGGRQVDMLERVVLADRDDERAWYVLSLARASTGDVIGQIEALRKVLGIDPSHDTARRCLGVGLALQGEFGEAERELGAAQRAAHSADVLASQGFVAAMRGDPQKAVERLEEALADTGLSVRREAVTQLGKLMMEQGRFREAEQYLEQALTLGQGNDTSRYLHAVALHARGLRREALSEYEALAKEKGSYSADAAVQSAHIHLGLGDVERARDAVERAGSLGAKSAAYYTVQGRVFAGLGNDVVAQDAFKRAVSVDPAYALAHLENGLQYIKREALTEGLDELERYLELVGPDAEGTRAFEIRTLAEQLRQTTGRSPRVRSPGAEERAQALTGRTAS